MKKSFLLVLSFLFLASLGFGDVFMTELADPNNIDTARFVELYNNGVAAVDLSTGYDLQRWTNGNAAPQSAVELTGSIPAGGFYIVCNNGTSFNTTYGFAADQILGTGGPADSNGDDQIALRDPSDAIIDMFGVPGEDGSGTNHEFENGRAERNGTVTTGNTTYTFAEWNIWNDTGGAGTTNDPQDAPADFDPGAWIGTGGNLLPSISNILRDPAGDVLASTTVEVSATVTDGDGTLSLVELHWGTTSGSLGNTINMTLGTGDTYITDTDIPAQTVWSTVYYEVYAEDDVPEGSTSSEYDYTVIEPATTTLPYSEPFTADLGACYTYSVSGVTKEWYWNSGGYAYMSGYDSGDTEEDWLILPGINLNSYTDEFMIFDTWYQYGSDDANNYLKLYYSTDYSGIGDPTSASWTEISYTQPASATTWASSGLVDISGISGTSVWIGFKYRYESGSYRNWSVDNISITEIHNLAPVISNIAQTPSSNIGTSTTVSISADVTDSDGTISSVELHWGLSSGSLGTTIAMSLDIGDTYDTDTDIPVQSEGATVYYEIYAVDNGTASTTSAEFSYYVSDALAPGVGDLLITEVVGDGAGGGSDDGFMEIYNNTSNTLSLANVQARYFNSNPGNPTQTVDLSGTIAPGAYVIITQNETNFNATYAPITADFYGSAFYFNGGDDGLDIYDTVADAGILDSFNDNGVGASPWIWSQYVFERTSPGDGALFDSWTEITTGIGTPGEENDNPLPVTLTDFSTAVIMNEFVQVNWTTQTESSINNWQLFRSTDNNSEQVLLNTQFGTNTTEPTTYTFEDYEVEEDITYNYYLEANEYDGASMMWGPISAILGNSTTPPITAVSMLQSNYPNPFNPSTTINCAIKDGEVGTLTIYNARGQVVEKQTLNAGEHRLNWNGTAYGSGVYLYKLETESYTKTRKMIMIK